MNMNKKGVAYSVVAIVALLGVLGVAIWSAYQLSVGGVGPTVTKRTAEDMAVAKLENTKLLVGQALRFGAMESSMQVASQGGTKEAVTYWYCNGEPTPPELEEVEFAISNKSLAYVNAYIKTLKDDEEFKKMGVEVSEYDCVGIYPPEKDVCLVEDCEHFDTGVSGGFIDVKEPAKATYSSGIETTEYPTRFWTHYYRLYDFFKSKKIFNIIINSIQGQCPGPDPMIKKARVAMEDVCDQIEQLLDPEYVECKVIELCEPDDVSCLNAPCERYFDEELCFKKAIFSGGEEQFPGERISAQGEGVTMRVKFEITDHKFKPLAKEDVQWNLYAVFEIGETECVPIDSVKT